MSSKPSLKENRQLERLKFIDLCAYTLGYVNRRLLTSRFDIEGAYASRDIKEYQAKTFEKLSYNTSLKAYEPVAWFEPMFEHTFEDAFLLISEGAQKISFIPKLAEAQVVTSIPGVEPDLKIIAPVLRALSRGVKVEVEYISTSSGLSKRLIAPHSLIAAGNFKYVRAFDHKTGEFRAFKLNRIVNARLTSWKIDEKMHKNSDQEWNEEATLALAANKNLKHKESIEFDFGLINGSKEIKIRRALIPFFLMDWNIAPQKHENLPATLFPLEVKGIK